MNKKKKFELFALKIEGKEHKECLQLLLYTTKGKNMFRHLILSLSEQKKKGDIDFSTIKIKKKKNQNIKIKNDYHIPPNICQSEDKIDQINQLINYLFIKHYKSNQTKKLENIDDLISIFESIWFSKKKSIYQVIHKIGEKDYHKLLLLPNNNIIYTNTNHNDNIILQNTSHFSFNEVQQKLLPPQNLFENCRLHFIGQVDPVYLVPRGQGILFNDSDVNENFCQFKCDHFFYTISNGQYEAIYKQYQTTQGIMKNGQEVLQVSKYISDKSIAYTDESNITEKFAKSLYPGDWLNQILVDYLIKQYYFQQLLLNQVKGNTEKLFNIVLLDTRESQDIFSSQITQADSINEEYSIKLLNNINTEKENRFIILLNVDRCHFICVCIEGKYVNILNSMNSERNDQIVGQKVKQFYTFIQKQLETKGLQNKYCQSEISILRVPQQTNGYDCSIYTLFNAMQLIKHSDMDIKKIKFEITPKQISELRFQFFQDIFNNNSILANKKQWFWNSGRL